jgi:aspartokinase
MVSRRGVAATMMGALAKANVNIKAIAQVRPALLYGSK